ncbi:MAG: cytochrome P450 [Lysobacteraceae bacterium]
MRDQAALIEGLAVPDGVAQGEPFDIDEHLLWTDPHGVIRALRAKTPVWCRHYGNAAFGVKAYSIFSHELSEAAAVDPRTRQFELEPLLFNGVTDGPLFELYANGMLASNGETHIRRRTPLSRQFAFPIIRRMQPEIAAAAQDLLHSYLAEGRMNVAEDYGKRFPVSMLCSILGVPPEDTDAFGEWIRKAAVGLGVFSPDKLDSINEGTERLLSYVSALLDDRRRAPRGDFLTDYLAKVDSQGDYSAEETYVQIAGAILAGSDTTRTAITMAISLLLEHPETWTALRADPDLATRVVDEVLRFEPAVGSVPRFVLEDLEIGGVKVGAGSILSISMLGALRDPAVFSNPDTFDIQRTTSPKLNLAFGSGAHRCLGEALARIEVEETVRAFVSMIPDAHLLCAPARVEGFSGVRHLVGFDIGW